MKRILNLCFFLFILLSITASPSANAQSFTFTSDDTIQPGVLNILYTFHAELTNTSLGTNLIQLDLDILNLPQGWNYSWCVGEYCFPPSVITFVDTLAPDSAHRVSVYIEPTSVVPQGQVTVSAFSEQNPSLIQEITFTIYFEEPVDYNPLKTIRKSFYLSPAFPNPFNPVTLITYSVDKSDLIEVNIYNLLGEKVRSLFRGYQNPGNYQIPWNGRDDKGCELPTGTYYISLTSSNKLLTTPVVKVK